MKLLIKEALRKIKLTFGRFLSVFFIVALGVGFFAGIRNTSDDMLFTVSSYFADKNLMDFRLVSTLGFTDADVEILKQMPSINDVEGSHYIDCLESSKAVRILGITNKINQLTLVDGRNPKNNKEVLADATVYEVGDELTLNTPELKETKVKVVGTVKSPMYIQFNNKGTTLIGNGKISGFLYTLESNFSTNVYTLIYLTGKDTASLRAYTQEYQASIEKLETKMTDALDQLKMRRYNEIKTEARQKIEDAKQKIEEEKEKYRIELETVKNNLDQTNKKLQKTDKEINEKEYALNQEFKQANQELLLAKKTLAQKTAEYQKNVEKYNQYKAYLECVEYIYAYDHFPDLSKMTDEEIVFYLLNLSEEDIHQFLEYMQQGDFSIELPEIDYNDKEAVKTYLETVFNSEIMQEIRKNIDFTNKEDLLKQFQKLVKDMEIKLDNAKEEIAKASNLLQEKEQFLNKKKKESQSALVKYKKEIETGYKQLEDGYREYEINYEKFEIQFKDAYTKINQQIKQVDEIEKPNIYVFTRKDNAGYEEYKSDTTRVNNISKVFPIFFLLVAALVCLNTMSRMVEEDRGQMGIYKSLGLKNRQILFTYILYATVATIFGSIIGLLLGCTILPNVIYNIYSFMYVLPNLKLENNFFTMIFTTILMFVVTLSITMYTALSVLKNTPASLLRPKAPAKGKKVLIEKISFIWKRLNFSFKVTTRNIFRYKKRIFMTIVGIAGCTALTLAGFGLKDSITGIIKKQFNTITKYKATIVLDHSYQELDKDMKEVLENNGITNPTLIYQELYNYKIKDKNNDVYLVVPSNINEMKQYITLQHRKDKEKVDFSDDGVIITEKMALNLNAGIGDFITIYDTNKKEYQVKVKEITENYAYNYIYLTNTYYEKIFDQKVNYNMVISGIDENKNIDQISESLLNTNKVLNVSFIEDILEKFNDMINNLNKIVLVILICSCLLAFVVLYNLTTINITERIREIATLKVLGFHDKEVSLYVYRETMILTILGALVGLFLGIFLHQFVITSAEMEFIMFQRNINSISYVYAFLVTILFSLIISVFTHYKLKKINMIEALKSVE